MIMYARVGWMCAGRAYGDFTPPATNPHGTRIAGMLTYMSSLEYMYNICMCFHAPMLVHITYTACIYAMCDKFPYTCLTVRIHTHSALIYTSKCIHLS